MKQIIDPYLDIRWLMVQPESSIAQVLRDGRAVGLAFVVGSKELLTCAHVVNVALGRDIRDARRPPPEVRLVVQFPLVGKDRDAPIRRVAVDMWFPTEEAFERRDVAGLVITADGIPAGASSLNLVSAEDVVDRRVQMWGPSSDRPTGGHVVGELMGMVEPGRLQVDQYIRGVFRAQPGFSGGPVWQRAAGQVVGMLSAAASGDATDAYVIDSDLLVEAWPRVLYRLPACPYRGLRAFTDSDAHLFFGRAAFIDRLLAAVDGNRIFAIIGSSGAGKSSVLQAGLIPRLVSSPGTLVVRMQPGPRPIDELAIEISAANIMVEGASFRQPESWSHELRTSGITACADRLAALARVERVAFVVDQFERILTRCPNEAERLAFLDLLADHASAGDSRHIIVAGIRDDYFGPILVQNDRLSGYLKDRFLVLSVMSRDELVEAIQEPARAADPAHPVIFDPGLVDQIVDDFRGRPAELPLLQFVLTLLWERQRDRTLTLASYRQAGGVASALTVYADDRIDSLSLSEQLSARRILTRLVVPDSRDVGRAAVRSELREMDWPVVALLESARLVSVRRDSDGAESVEIAHEALLRGWRRLRAWLDEDREVLMWADAVRSARLTWEAESRHPSLLLRGPVLARAEQMLYTFPEDADHLRFFIEASRGQEDQDEQQRQTLLHRSEALRLAVQSELACVSVAGGYSIGLALGIESMARLPTFEGDNAIRRALAKAAIPGARLTHRGSVTVAIFSPDGGRVATASADGACAVWDAVSGAELVRLGHGSSVTAVVFSPDGGRVATASTDNTCGVWDGASGAELARLGHRNSVNAVQFSPDGTRIATASDDGTCALWDAVSGTELARLCHERSVLALIFSPDGSRVATASADGTGRVWDPESGVELVRFTHDGWVNAVAFSPDGMRVATASDDGTCALWDAVSGAELARLSHGSSSVNAVAFAPDGARVATGGADSTGRVWDVATGTELARLTHERWVLTVAFSSAGTKIITSADHDTSAHLWDAVSGAELKRLGHGGSVNAVVFSPDGGRVATASADSTCGVWDAMSGAELKRLGHGGSVNAVAFSLDGTRVATGSADNTGRVWDPESGVELVRFTHDGWVNAVAFSPDGMRVATASDDGTCALWDAVSGAELARLHHGRWVTAVMFSPDGMRVATASDDGTCALWDVMNGAELARLTHRNSVNAVAFCSDSGQVATASADGTCGVWDAVTGAALVRLSHGNSVNAVAFSPDGTRIATAAVDNTGRVWDVGTGLELIRFTHDSSVNAVAFSPDGTRIATASVDNTARVWEAATGRELARLTHDDWVNGISFAADGRSLATSSADWTARIWPLRPEDLIAQARRRLTRNLTGIEWRRYLLDEKYHKLREDLP
jgi:WD40 repeat protein